ncbi:MAG TPA: DUF6502 family protein [Gammaproteobacteria bacterium]
MQQAAHELPSAGPVSSPALRFIGSVLRPVVRMCMRLGVSANQANDLMRWLFVDEFYRTENLWHRRQPFASRAALLSGLSRKEVARLKNMDTIDDAVVTERQNRAARVLAGWRNDRRFLDEQGNPKPLPIKSADSVASFHTLVMAYSGDMPPRTVLDELRRAECVKVEEGEQVVLVDSVYGPRTHDDEYLETVRRVMAALGSSADFNVTYPNAPDGRMMRIWFQNNIPAERLDEARKLIQDSTIRFGRQMDAELANMAHRERLPGQEYVRTGLGGFFFQD